MGKPKIIFIGDYKNKETTELLKVFLKQYSKKYDVLISGYSFDCLKNDGLNNYPCFGMSSSKYLYYKNTAEYVIITTQAPHFTKEKINQKLIYILPDFDIHLFEGCVGDINEIITCSEAVKELITNSFKHIQVKFIEHISVEQILEVIDIEPEPLTNKIDYLVVSANVDNSTLIERNGLHHYFRKITGDSGNNVIICNGRGLKDYATSTIPLNNSLTSISVLQEFDGTILFDSDVANSFFKEFVEKNNISLNTDNKLMLSDLKLALLDSVVLEFDNTNQSGFISDYVRYRTRLDQLYTINNCSESKVSIVTCRYNTPLELLYRAIESALNSGHENIEIVVVDDGSEDNIADFLNEKYSNERIKYFYKDNEGPGPARNYGVEKANGKYVFFLDSDDTIHKDGLKSLVSHADFFELDMVVGKRILCDENGIPRNESLKYLAGDTFTCYFSKPSDGSIYTDAMVTNKLIRRESLKAADISFNEGVYEDVEYSSLLYSRLPEYHYVNIPIHDWYQYGTNSTISSTVSIRNLEERIIKEEKSWDHYPEEIKINRMSTILNNDFNLYLYSFHSFAEEEQSAVFSTLREFIEARKQYVFVNALSEKSKELTKAILAGDIEYFRYVIERYYYPKRKECEQYNAFVVCSHDQLYTACIYALNSSNRSRLYLSYTDASFNTNTVYKIKETGIFDTVKLFSHWSTEQALFEEIKQRPGEEEIIIPEYLYNKYKDIFKECDPLNDTIYIFSDLLPYWYYIEREFRNIVVLENEFDSFGQELRRDQMPKKWEGIQEYEGKLYPLTHCRSDKISKIVVGSESKAVPEHYTGKVEVHDINQLEKKVHEELGTAMRHIYDIDHSLFSDDATLLITEPLAKLGYCSKKAQKMLMKTICAKYEGRNLFIKPHPDDDVKYNDFEGVVLPKNVPAAAYNYLDVNIARVISFSSNAADLIDFAREKKSLIIAEEFTISEIQKAIGEHIITEPSDKKRRIKDKAKRFIKH